MTQTANAKLKAADKITEAGDLLAEHANPGAVPSMRDVCQLVAEAGALLAVDHIIKNGVPQPYGEFATPPRASAQSMAWHVGQPEGWNTGTYLDLAYSFIDELVRQGRVEPGQFAAFCRGWRSEADS